MTWFKISPIVNLLTFKNSDEQDPHTDNVEVWQEIEMKKVLPTVLEAPRTGYLSKVPQNSRKRRRSQYNNKAGTF